MKDFLPVVTNCVFKYDTLVFYDEHCKGSKRNIEDIPDMEELRKKRFSGKFATASSKSCKNIVKRWLAAYEVSFREASSIPYKLQKRLVLLTLTLPATQVHSDQLIKAKCLDPLISMLKSKFSMVNYVWKAELQKNHNIHFHLIIDCYADKIEIRKVWEQCLDRLGYMKRFRLKHGGKSTRTTQIEAIRDTKSMYIYLLKYITKDNADLLPLGRVWGCSDKLRQLKDFACSAQDIDSSVFEVIRSKQFAKFNYDEFYTLIYASCSLLQLTKNTRIGKVYIDFLISSWLSIYDQ